jgi:acyl-CoA oxidase
MTAEGDNSVLMQKVAKERLGQLIKNPPSSMPTAPGSQDLNNKDFLLYLMQVRELKLFKELGEKMAVAGKAGTFSTWMLEESDLIQMAARAYGDLLISTR